MASELGWRVGAVVSEQDSQPEGRGFDHQRQPNIHTKNVTPKKQNKNKLLHISSRVWILQKLE